MERWIVTICLFTSLLPWQVIYAQERQKGERAASCGEFAPPKKEAGGKSIGVEECRIISEEVVFNIKGHKFQRLELRISGWKT